MASLASCLVISLGMAGAEMGAEVGEVSLDVEAFIDGGLPRRFDRFVVRVSMPQVDDPALARELVARAKRICTVSATLHADIAVEPIT